MSVNRDPRVDQLATILSIRRYQAEGLWIMLRMQAEDRYPIGDFRDLTAEQLASMLLFQDSPDRLVHALISVGMLERRETGFFVADWVDKDSTWFAHSASMRRLNAMVRDWEAGRYGFEID